MATKSNADSKFWKFVNLTGNAFGMNMLFLLACLPVVTIGPALCALYSAERFMIRGDGWFAGFKEGFCKGFLRTTIAWLVCLGMMAYLVLNFNVAFNFFNEGGSIVPMLFYGIGMLFPTMIAAALWPLNVYIPYKTTDWLRNAVTLVFKAPGPVLLTAVLMWLPLALFLYWTALAFYGSIVIIAIYFALAVFVSTIFLKDPLLQLLLTYREEHPADQEERAEKE